MKIKTILFGILLVFCGTQQPLTAQERKPLTLEEAINLAVNNSTAAAMAETRVETSALAVDNVKNNHYPEFTISGQYQRLTSPTVNFKLPIANNGGETEEGATATSSPEVNQIMLGQASLGMPLFSGFRLKNSIAATEDLHKAEQYNAASTKEQLALQAVMLYVNLYKAEQSVTLIQENLRSANQRVTDFTAMEKNGLLARNDLLKAQLQASNIELSLEDAKRQAATINYQLAVLLKLPENTQILPDDAYFMENKALLPTLTESEAVAQRNDLEALRWQQKAAEANIKVAQADYYPSVSLMAGYVALDIQNVVQVYNAVNFGVGLKYDISSIFKNRKKVAAEKSRAEEARQAVELMSDRVKVQVKDALEHYNLAIKQNSVYTQAVTQAEENYRIVKDKYDNGLSDTNDLLEADVQKLQAQLNEAFSKADITQRYYELLNASGKLANTINLTQTN
ncbi:TolC family protein [Flavobacterium coralii]|uniref:TolC family protein n=1 Tax=Flavobacterium coralii TaxID=2838017 RepID=UPI000C6A87AB|nr:transporter [Flavobacterium sp.]|tara:strand:+ start:24905 stop:26266 length:1362 start_codon:yes stop_codon:yes gene_type:complete